MKPMSHFFGVAILCTVATFAGHASAQSCVQPPEGLVSWWPGDGNADDIQGDNPGTLVGAVTFVSGLVDQAFLFDGSTEYAVTEDPGPLGGSARSVLVWARTSSTDGQTLFSYGGPEGAGTTFRAQVNVTVYGDCEGVSINTSNTLVTYFASVADDEWHHYAWIVPEGARTNDVRVYQDGILLTDVCHSFGSNPLVNTGPEYPVHIGRFNLSQQHKPGFFNGALDEVSLFDRALSGEEVAAIVSAGSAGMCKRGVIFAGLHLRNASLKFFYPGMDSFHISADFVLGEGSDGVDPGVEDVTVSFGTYTETLPAGEFDCRGSDCVYENKRGRGISRATIGDGFLEFKARRVDLSGTANPTRFSVQIGDDSGATVAHLAGHLGLCGLGFELLVAVLPIMWLRRRLGSRQSQP